MARTWTWTAWSGVECTNHEITAPTQRCKGKCVKKSSHKPDDDVLVAETFCIDDAFAFVPVTAPLEGATIVITIFLRTVCDWLAIDLGTLSAGSSSSGFLPPVLSSCSADVSVWIVGLPFGLDDGMRTRTCEPCFGFLAFFLSLLLVFMPSPFPCWIYCSTSLGEILSTGTKNNGEPFVVGRGTEETPFLPAPLV